MSFLDELQKEITARGIDSPPPTGGLLRGEYLETRDALVVLFETGPSGGDIVTHDGSTRYIGQSGQVQVRDIGYAAARDKAFVVWNFFNRVIRNRVMQGTYYLILEALGEPAFLQRDGNNRFYFFFNFRALKEPS